MDEILKPVLSLILLLFSFPGYSGVVMTGTRIIYPADKKEITISLKNTNNTPTLVQTWIDTGDPVSSPHKIIVPFILTPPIFRMEGGKGQVLRLRYTGNNLPEDRESLFWLNVLAVPPKQKETNGSYLNAAFQTRVKLFYRPGSLSGHANQAANKLEWQRKDGKLTVHNPTAYFISLVSVSWRSQKSHHEIAGEVLSPFSTTQLRRKDNALLQPMNDVKMAFVNDIGALKELSVRIDD